MPEEPNRRVVRERLAGRAADERRSARRTLARMAEPEVLPCPACGTPVRTLGMVGKASRQVLPRPEERSEATETNRCPNDDCGKKLVRDMLPGAPWRVAD